eukprot:CAMPEP_0201531426 /NCGR_PEP_ID=MMETSP0161_2-20130828/47597_1 /ASSEMBLY_ACC=CAM_ASM_000251 /TAXON_ID=180227 /ORGANISM="Neoparamoeba aestuarina, Strain SoJaBio B1-5/56/2" /LENGTH=65 /DNA_ID=CAMNT_0047934335 /DNA_START=546 /DNA_END=739 /DNA_ORIENTATION=-
MMKKVVPDENDKVIAEFVRLLGDVTSEVWEEVGEWTRAKEGVSKGVGQEEKQRAMKLLGPELRFL